MSWLAVKEFCKKTWSFVVDQWLFFVALVLGVLGFFLGSRGSEASEVLDAAKKAEGEERDARQDAQDRTEQAYEILNEKLSDLTEQEKKLRLRLLKITLKSLRRRFKRAKKSH